MHHDSPLAGHPGRWKTVELITHNYWWPSLTKMVGEYCLACETCRRAKISHEATHRKLMPNDVPDRSWKVVTMDFITQLPGFNGYTVILVVMCLFTKIAHFIPTTNKCTSEKLVRLLRNNVWKLYGLFEIAISNRGSQFASKFTAELAKILGIEICLSTAFHPQTNGQVERMNQELEQYLRMFVEHRQLDWSEWLPTAEFSINNRIVSATKNSSFFLNYG